MEDLLSQIVSYLRGMWRYRWWALAVAWIVGIAGGVVVYTMPDQYRSSARVFVDTQSVLRPLMSGLAIQPNVEQQVAILTRTLISRPNMDRLITMADLDLTIRSPADREALTNKLMSDLRIGQGGRGNDNMFTLSYQDTDPQRAHAVVQALLSLFVESGLVGKRADSDSARRFIEEQITAYEARLSEAENRLKDFRLRNMALLGDGSTNFLTQISAVTQQLNQARLELREAETSATAFREQLANESPTATSSNLSFEFSPTAELDARIDGLERDLDAMLLRYTEQHPDVIATRSLMERLEEQRQATLDLMQNDDGDDEFSSQPSTNPVYQQIKFSLSNAEARVAGLTARVAEFEERLEFLRERAELLPRLEAEEAQLNRDYGVHRRNYEQLVQRRESATMSVEMAAQSGIADFRVIEPPSRPTQPSAPNRLMLMPLVGVAALGVGLGLAFLLSQIRPAFNSGRMLREVSGLPVLGTVSRVAGPTYKHARRLSMLAFGGGLISYALAIAAAMAAMQILQR